MFLKSGLDNVIALVWLASAVCLALGWDLGMVDETKETLYQSYWIEYTEMFFRKRELQTSLLCVISSSSEL